MDDKYYFILKYLEYLTRWNHSESLKALIKDVESGWKNYNFSTLIEIVKYEYHDTMLMTEDYVKSLEEITQILISENRNKKIDEIFKN